MTNFIKFHGLSLSDNSYIENLSIESLVSDPIDPLSQRLWYNSTEQVIKYSEIIDNVTTIRNIVNSYELNIIITTINDAISTETTDRIAADAVLSTNLATEVTDRTAADNALQNTINNALDLKADTTYVDSSISDLIGSAPETLDTLNELAAALGDDANHVTTMTTLIGTKSDISYVDSAVNTLTTNLATEVTDRTAADAVLTTNLATEVTDRIASDAILTTNLATEVTDRIAADAVLTTNLATEVTDRTAADAVLTTNLATETTNRIAADTLLTTNLATEVTDRTAADAVLTTNLATETTDRIAADTLLTTNLSTEVTDRTAADAVLTTNLATETTNRIAADAALQNTINDALDLKSDISYVDALVGSITTTLLDLTDTTLTSPSNGQVLSYDFTNSKWVNTDLPPPLTTLLDLTDTTLSTPTDGQVLSYDTDSNKWVNTNRPGVVGSSINPLDVNSVVESFVFDGNLSLTLSNHISSLENIFVTFDGLLQLTTEYNVGVNTDILVLSGQQPIGTIIEVRHLISPSMDNTTESFISNGETSFTLSESIISDVDIFVTFDGLLQGQSSYGVNGNSLTLTESQPNGVNIGVRKLSSYIITDFDSIDGGTY